MPLSSSFAALTGATAVAAKSPNSARANPFNEDRRAELSNAEFTQVHSLCSKPVDGPDTQGIALKYS